MTGVVVKREKHLNATRGSETNKAPEMQSMRHGAGVLFLVVASLLSSTAARAQFTQQGNKLVGSGAVNGNQGAFQGSSVSLSSDGNTALVGGWVDSIETGAAWVFVRTNGVWSQQGSKLVGTGAVGSARQSISVALSGDGNTAIVGGVLDSSSTGAAWVFRRTGSVWSQQGSKLVGTGQVGKSEQGVSVSLSADGNTALVGGNFDDSLTGAVWVYTRTGGVWSQQGGKLVGTGAVGRALQGGSVSLSADGNMAIVGGYADSNEVGAAWVYTRTGSAWSQQGAKLVGTGAVGNARQGMSVSLSADGNTAIVGGYLDNNLAGAAWVFRRAAGVWSQQGSKLVGTDAEHGLIGSFQGFSVSLSGDGNTAIVGGYADSNFTGAAWVYVRAGGVWNQLENKLVGTGASGKSEQGVSVSLSGDGSTAIVGAFADNNFAGAAWVYTRAVSSVREPGGEGRLQFGLGQNYPNPFNPTTAISFQLSAVSEVKLAVYDLLGREVAVLVNERKEPGSYEVKFDGSHLPTGVYFYRLMAADPSTSSGQALVSTKRLLLLK
jgi:hypothetical protein